MPQRLPRNAELADQLDLLADLSEILGEDSFRVIAYRRAATRIRETPAPVAELALDGKAKELPGVGRTIQQKVVEVVNEGEIQALARRRERVPAGVVEFLRLPGVGPKTAARIWTQLGITTLDGLRVAAEEGRLRELSGMGQRSEEKILGALAAGTKKKAETRGLLGAALPAVRRVVEELLEHPASIAVSEAGSVRRRREMVADLDLIATSSDAAALIEAFCGASWVAEVAARGETKATVVGHDGLRFDLRVVPPECYGNVLQHFTGSKDHNIALHEEAQRRGLSISEYGVTVVESGEVVTHASEEELYRYLGYAFIPPELRENAGEVKAARDGALPELVELADLRGEMHCHSTWSSDGNNTIEEMATTAKARGYTFLCLTDHSHYLRAGRLELQWQEIEAVNKRLKSFRVLRGIEVNIRADGTLDVEDDVLATLDWVVASLHTSFERSPTERVLAAVDNPHVDCIRHHTGRKPTRRDGEPLAVDWVASYLERVRELPVLAQVEPGAVRAALPRSPPDEPEPFGAVLRDLDEVLLPGLSHSQSPRWFAYFGITSSEPGVLAELLIAGLNQLGILWRTSPVLQELEELTLDWLAQLLGLPEGLHGHIEDTASTSTLVSLAAARSIRPDARTVLCSEHAHSSVDKAAKLLELDLRKVPADDEFRLRPELLELDGACAVVATIGTTSTTSVDPVPAIADRCAAAGVWLHVDAAYAGTAALCPELRHHFAGWERADSIVVNPHKWPGVPIDCSTLWTRRPDVYRDAFSLVPEYLRVGEEVASLSEYTQVLGRRFRALKLWAVLRCYGRTGLQGRIREHVRLAALFEGWVRADAEWEVVAPRPFSVVCFRLRRLDEENERLLERVNASGDIFVSHTRLRGRYVLRLAIGNCGTTEEDVRFAWEVLRREASRS